MTRFLKVVKPRFLRGHTGPLPVSAPSASVSDANTSEVPCIIWMLWFQGYDAAPELVRAAHASWVRLNPGHRVHFLDVNTLADFLPAPVLEKCLAAATPQARSNLIRIDLLARYGGVWADATSVCARPLDEWLPEFAQTGFFGFDQPSHDRMISNWFLAAAAGNYLIKRWRDACFDFWVDRQESDIYFWMHREFGTLYQTDPEVRALWDRTPKISAVNPFHFGPNASALTDSATEEYLELLSDPPVPVFKLTHKFDHNADAGSLMCAIMDFAVNRRGKTGTAI